MVRLEVMAHVFVVLGVLVALFVRVFAVIAMNVARLETLVVFMGLAVVTFFIRFIPFCVAVITMISRTTTE
jgi:hypothetical protein